MQIIIHNHQQKKRLIITGIVDDIMIELSKEYPQYDWQNNMGYLTKKHLESVKEFGLCDHHRKSYTFKI